MAKSSLNRLVRLGGLVGRVGGSLVGERLRDLGRDEEQRQTARTESLVKNATRIVETLGELKGAAMKMGQMLSLHEGLLPPEAAAVLRSLQKQAPSVPFEVMEYEVKGALPDYDRLFVRLVPEPIGAASIGQVHRGILRDGRRVAVKIQYPLIEEIIHADLDNLRRALKALFSLISKVDFDPVWREVRDRLLEELDYEQEAANLRRMAELYAGDPRVVIPEVVEEASCRRVLTMEYVEGLSAEEVCSERFEQEERDRWGQTLLELVLAGLFEHRFLHADPNLANFAFREGGRVVVYDLGCVKRVPAKVSTGYAELALAVLGDRRGEIPELLQRLGVYRRGEGPLALSVIEPYVDLFQDMFRATPPYTFGEDEELYDRILELGMANWDQAAHLEFPEDVVFIDRTLAGHLGNLIRLRATGPWREMVQRYASAAMAAEEAAGG